VSKDKPYEVIEHTADIGLVIRGKKLDELFVHAAHGLFDLMTDVKKIRQRVRKEAKDASKAAMTLRLEGEDAGDLFLKWLRELLFIFSTRRIVFDRFDCRRLTEKELEFDAAGFIFDPQKDVQRAEVKAVTYHEFKMEKKPEGWTARVILDV
jgi:SHS2 domain-containing protein